jgi:hypothetical protein
MNPLPLSTNITPAPDKNTSPDDFMSKERRKVDALFSIKRTRNGIGDAINILTDGHKVLSNPNSTKQETRSVLSDIKNIVIPYGNHAGQVIESETKQLHNIASLEYAFNCDEVDRRQALDAENIPTNIAKLGPPQRCLFHLMNDAKSTNDHPLTKPDDPRTKKRRKAGRTLPLKETIELPEPANGRHYSKAEFLSVMSTVACKKERSILIDKMANMQVPIGRNAMYSALRQAKGGLQNCSWNARGRPRMISKEGLINICSHLDRMGGKTIGNVEVRENIIEFQQEAIRQRGRVPIGVHIQPSQQTIRNYSACLAAMKGMDVVERTTIKSST